VFIFGFLCCKASSGIGKASAEAIAARGYYVVIGRSANLRDNLVSFVVRLSAFFICVSYIGTGVK
jgi:NAD(P)-dependent dehydrogenase (short-subunit alcohol dehydrogenase family)